MFTHEPETYPVKHHLSKERTLLLHGWRCSLSVKRACAKSLCISPAYIRLSTHGHPRTS